MNDADNFKNFSTEQLTTELARRTDIQNSEWPKKFELVLSYDDDNDSAFHKFLEDQCGFYDGSLEFDTACMAVSEINVLCEINKDALFFGGYLNFCNSIVFPVLPAFF